MREATGAFHVKATPYLSQGNAVVERANQTLEEKIRLVLDDPMQERHWDAVLPIALPAVNTSFHSSIGCSPFEITFGRRPPLLDKTAIIKTTPQDIFAKLVKARLLEFYENAVRVQSASRERAKEIYDNKRRAIEYQMGEQVLIRKGPRDSKFAPRFKGPYTITRKDKDIYYLKNSKGKTTSRHVQDLRPINQPTPGDSANGSVDER